METTLKNFWLWTERHGRLRQLLVALNINERYHQAREACLKLRYGRRKKITIEDVECFFPLTGPVEREFFCQCQFGEAREAEVVRHMLRNMRTSRCFVDVGANLGFYSILAAKAMKAGTVHAIEMDAENISRIREAATLNNLNDLVVHHVALGSRETQVTYYRAGSTTHTLAVTEAEKKSLATVEVPMVPLDTLARQFDIDVDLIKIDVEGAELEVLKGMTDILETSAPKVYVEVHLHEGRGSLALLGGSLSEILCLFEKLGYNTRALNLDANGTILDEPICSSDPPPGESVMLFAERSNGKN